MWKENIVAILQLSKIIILDVRTITKAVQFEIAQAATLPDPGRVFYVGQKTGSVPPDRCFGEVELLNNLRMKYKPSKKQPGRSSSSAIYEDKKNGYFRFHPPEGWTCFEFNDPRTKVKFSHPANPAINFLFIVKEALSTDFSSLLSQQKNMIRKAEMGLGGTYKLDVNLFGGRQTIEAKIEAPNSERILNRLFLADGLHFNISFTAPNKAMFDTFLKEVDQSLETIEPLNRRTQDGAEKQAMLSEQEKAHKIRLAELCADSYDLGEAQKIVAQLLSEYPEDRQVQDLAKALGSLK